jgi:hypothetical protein
VILLGPPRRGDHLAAKSVTITRSVSPTRWLP